MCPPATALRVLLVDDARRGDDLARALAALGHSIVAHGGFRPDLLDTLERIRADIICMDVHDLAPATLESLSQIQQRRPTPILIFVSQSDTETTRRAVQSGVSAYVVDGLEPPRLQNLLEVAIARFDLYQTLREELQQARTRLADQRDIEKAQGLIMKRQQLDEASAYGLLRRLAMDRKQRIGEVARALLIGADVLLGDDKN